MIVHHPELIRQDDKLILAARLETQTPVPGWPEYLWYRFPAEYEPYISLHSDAFLLPVLAAAMNIREDVHIRGAVSPALAQELATVQHLYTLWEQDFYHPVEISYEQLRPLAAEPMGVGLSFSGGLDSFYSLWRHLPQNIHIPEYHITHGLFIGGFDMPLTAVNNYEHGYARYAKMFDDLGLTLLKAETNVLRLTHGRIPLRYCYPFLLLGSVHALGGLFKRFYISNSRTYAELAFTNPVGSTPFTDPLKSSDTLEVVHFGAAHPRSEKMETLAGWEPYERHLRVCYIPDFSQPAPNCGWCEKCNRTMLPLYLMGEIDKFAAFRRPYNRAKDIFRWGGWFKPGDYNNLDLFGSVSKFRPALWPLMGLAVLYGLAALLLNKIFGIGRVDPITVLSQGADTPYELEYIQSLLQLNKNSGP